jgi:predicted phage tail protein
MMQRVILLDELGEKFGSVHEYYNLRTPVDAIRLLTINYPEFGKDLLESGEKGVAYKVIQSETEFELEDMLLPFGSKDLIITPVIAGSGNAGRIVLGVALIGLAVATGGVSLGATGFVGASGIPLAASYSTTMAAIAVGGNIGIALTLGGISQMLSPQPQEMPRFTAGSNVMDSGAGSIVRGSDGRQSYAYRGAINSVGAGATIPVAFGKTLIGSHIISADMQVTDESDPLNEWIKTPSPETMRIQGEKLDSVFKETSGMKSRRINDQDISGGVRYLSSSVAVDIDDTTRQRIGGEFKAEFSGNTDVTKFQVAFRLNNGLYKEIAGEGSTKVDGFITYKIIIENRNEGKVTSTIQVTAQGLMSGSQSYSWVNWFTIGKFAHKDDYKIFIEPVDHSANLNVNTLEVIQFGYYFVNPDT